MSGTNSTSGYLTDDIVTDTGVKINVFYAILFPILIFTASVLNLTTILAFWKVSSLRDKPSELLILNLCCNDLITSMFVLPMVSPLYITPWQWPSGEIGCRIVTGTMNICIHGSLFALIAISLDRFLLVYVEYPMYIKIQSYERIYVTIAVCWATAIATVIIEQGMWEPAKGLDETAASINYEKICLTPPRRIRWFSLSFFAVLFFVPVISVCILSVAFIWQLSKRLKKTKNSGLGTAKALPSTSTQVVEMSSAASLSNSKPQADYTSSREQLTSKKNLASQSHHARNVYIKPAITLIGLVLSMAICMLPYCIYVIVIESGCQLCNNVDILYALILLQFCNACVDPFIYVFTRRKMRQFYVTCFCRCRIRTSFS